MCFSRFKRYNGQKRIGIIGRKLIYETSSSDGMGFKKLVFMLVASKFV